ncbi:MAG TPA: ATP-binding protein [Gemmatimonadaceae bacterium]|nr:ATP-binding protein [Gemmatimonadaceae bacterium]
MQGTYDPLIVALSVLTAMLAVYVALDLTGRVAAANGLPRAAWVLAGALATGVGMWTMHFTGMLALRLPVPARYALGGIATALLIAVAASVMSLLVAASQRAASFWVVGAGILLGLGMGAMHVVAMGSMHMAASPVFDNRLIALSMVIAIAAGIALVALASRLRDDETWHGWRQRMGAAAIIGAMIATMHYTAMFGTSFAPSALPVDVSSSQLVATHGLAFTAMASCALMLLLALGGAAVDRTLRHRLAATSEHARLRSEAEAARDAAQAANRAKSDFLAAMSHELRTPLNAISGYTELLQLGVHGPLNAKQQEDLARIQRSQKHLLSLINDVLNFAKIEAGKVQLHPRAIDVRSLLTSVETMIAPQITARGLSFFCRADAAALELYCDPDKTEQILLNLLSNAVKFTPSGGGIELASAVDGGVARLTVRDTGVGIPSDKLDVIFEPFVQVERNLTRTIEGAGLGLAISRDLARAMGGDLTASSRPGAGSTFVLTLPMHAPASQQSDTGVSNGRQANGKGNSERRSAAGAYQAG